MTPNINRHNVGRIAERIVANELEYRGFRVSDLNKEGTAANADLLAVSSNQILQIQVKGSSNVREDHLWVGWGYFTEEILRDRNAPIFNRRKGNFYEAHYVVLVAVCSPTKYACFVLPIEIAEKAARLHRDAFRYKHGKTHLKLKPGPRAKESDPRLTEERDLLARYRDEQGWECLLQSNRGKVES